MRKDYEARKRIGGRIKEVRTRLGMSQEELAERAELSQPHVSRIEDGRYSVTIDLLQAIAEALGCTVDIIQVGADDELGRT